MELEKNNQGGALVHYTTRQQKIAVGLGAAGVAMVVMHVFPFYFPLAAGIGALLMSWDAATSRDKRTVAATAAFVLGAVPLASMAIGLAHAVLSSLFTLLIIGAIVGGAFWGISSMRNKKPVMDEDLEPDAL